MAKRKKADTPAADPTTTLEVLADTSIKSGPDTEAPIVESTPDNNPRATLMKEIVAKRQEQLKEEIEQHILAPVAEPIETPEPAPSPPDAGPPPPGQIAAQAPQEEAPDDEPKYKINVNGREQEVSLDDLKTLAQKSSAAQEAWQDAHRLRQQAQQMMFGPPQAQPVQQAPQNTPANQVIPDEVIDKFARDMNYGSPEEQRKATRDLIDGVLSNTGRQNMPTPQDMVQAATRNALAVLAQQQAVERVGQEFSDIFQDTDLTQLAMNAMQRSVQDQQARYQAGLEVKPKTNYDMMRESCQYVREKFSKAPPSNSVQAVPVSSEKLERKRAAPSQPAAANKVATEQPKKQTWEKSPKEIFADIKKARHQQFYQ